MKLADTKIRQGGLMRCCIATIQDYDADAELGAEFIMDCKYEESGNQRILYKDGVWQWNPALERSDKQDACPSCHQPRVYVCVNLACAECIIRPPRINSASR